MKREQASTEGAKSSGRAIKRPVELQPHSCVRGYHAYNEEISGKFVAAVQDEVQDDAM